MMEQPIYDVQHKASLAPLWKGGVVLHYPFGSVGDVFLGASWGRRFGTSFDKETLQKVLTKPKACDGGMYIIENTEDALKKRQASELDHKSLAVSLVGQWMKKAHVSEWKMLTELNK